MHQNHSWEAKHAWEVSIEEAKAIQLSLANQVITDHQLDTIRYVAGTDIGFEKNNTITRAVVAILSFPELELVEYQITKQPTTFPYVPGYLSFRECPALLMALEKLKQLPDLILCDGQGIAHPRRLGIASHIGVLTGIPTIGVAKSRLTGFHKDVGINKGDYQLLMDRKQHIIGATLRSRNNTLPLYISAGHKISLSSSLKYVLACTTKYRLPETTRWADGIASAKSAFINRLDNTDFLVKPKT